MAKDAVKNGASRSTIKKFLKDEGVESISELDEAQAVSFARKVKDLG